ncbi:HEAT repeat domain-containing protein, partial [Candidatus Acetothermia bacterium]|nr:HEAT repeat domain-containing protein [Candidatus Acetothermia bacterium]
MNYFRVVGVGFFLAILLILAGTNDVRSQQREAVDTKQLRQEAVHIMLQAFDNTDLSTRLTVLSDLKEVRVPEALPALVNLLKDQKYRREAIDALGNQVPDPVVIQLISQYMASERSPFTRRQAVLALERLAERQAIPALIKTLLRDPERFVSAEAARVLGIFKDSTALPALMKTLDEALQLHKEALEKARNPSPQPGFGLNFYPVTFLPNVVGALLAFKEQTAIPAFIELIKAQAPSFGGTLVPFYSGLAFFPILVSSKDEVFNSILKEALRPLLSDPNPAIRLRTALTLMYWGDAAAMSAVAALLEQAKTASLILRQLIVFEFFALTTRGIDLDDALFPAISDLIDSLAGPTPPNDDQFARETARTFLIDTLGYIGSERAVRKILEIADQVSHACPELNPLYVPRYATLIALTAA